MISYMHALSHREINALVALCLAATLKGGAQSLASVPLVSQSRRRRSPYTRDTDPSDRRLPVPPCRARHASARVIAQVGGIFAPRASLSSRVAHCGRRAWRPRAIDKGAARAQAFERSSRAPLARSFTRSFSFKSDCGAVARSCSLTT